MRILVTGNKGYIGSVLCARLIQEGFEVIGLDTGFYDGCNFCKPGYTVRQLTKDIREIKKADLDGFDAVIHLAALSNDPMGALNPGLTAEINFLASVKIAIMAREAKVKRFIFSSSCSVYGVTGDKMVDENGLLDPVTEYAKSKVDTEREISSLADEGFTPVFLRNATVYGVSPMLRVDLVVNNLTGWGFTCKNIRIMSDGTPWRPLVHIQDLSGAFLAVLKAPREIVHNQVFNVGKNSENYRVKDLAEIVQAAIPGCAIEYTGEHGADVRNYRVDFSKFQKALGKNALMGRDVEKGVDELCLAYKNTRLNLSNFQGDKFTRLKRIQALLNNGKLDKNLRWIEAAEK